MLYNRIRRFSVPKELRRPIGIILAEITKPPQRRTKTKPYFRGVTDGVALVRKRAEDMGISLEEPYTEVPVKMALVEINEQLKQGGSK